jgi:hypothetical protein
MTKAIGFGLFLVFVGLVMLVMLTWNINLVTEIENKIKIVLSR